LEAIGNMPYNPWTQFRRQRWSVGLSGATSVSGGLVYANRPQPPPIRWQNYDRFSLSHSAAVSAVTGWQQDAQGYVFIPLAGVPDELLEAVENYGAFLQSVQRPPNPLIAPSAVGTVMYDVHRDELVYGASGTQYPRGFHAILAPRLAQFAQYQGGSLHPQGLPPYNCAEVHALNWACELGCQETDLHVAEDRGQ
jgi:hypothetical protein